jgi:hypothetical protein
MRQTTRRLLAISSKRRRFCPFQCNPNLDRLSSVSFRGMTDATEGVHRGIGERGGVAGGGAGAAVGYVGAGTYSICPFCHCNL